MVWANNGEGSTREYPRTLLLGVLAVELVRIIFDSFISLA